MIRSLSLPPTPASRSPSSSSTSSPSVGSVSAANTPDSSKRLQLYRATSVNGWPSSPTQSSFKEFDASDLRDAFWFQIHTLKKPRSSLTTTNLGAIVDQFAKHRNKTPPSSDAVGKLLQILEKQGHIKVNTRTHLIRVPDRGSATQEIASDDGDGDDNDNDESEEESLKRIVRRVTDSIEIEESDEDGDDANDDGEEDVENSDNEDGSVEDEDEDNGDNDDNDHRVDKENDDTNQSENEDDDDDSGEEEDEEEEDEEDEEDSQPSDDDVIFLGSSFSPQQNGNRRGVMRLAEERSNRPINQPSNQSVATPSNKTALPVLSVSAVINESPYQSHPYLPVVPIPIPEYKPLVPQPPHTPPPVTNYSQQPTWSTGISCPICNQPLPIDQSKQNQHIDECLNLQALREEAGSSMSIHTSVSTNSSSGSISVSSSSSSTSIRLDHSASTDDDDNYNPFLLVCPFNTCGRTMEAMSFYSHVLEHHSRANERLECPICALMGGPPKVVAHMMSHLVKEHTDLVLASPETKGEKQKRTKAKEKTEEIPKKRQKRTSVPEKTEEIPKKRQKRTSVPEKTKTKYSFDKFQLVSDQDDECSICFGELIKDDQMAMLTCHCIFHERCIVEWFTKCKEEQCPIHRKD